MVGRMPTRLLAEEGLRMELMVSVPMPMMPKLQAMAAPVPPEEPPGVRVYRLAQDGADGFPPNGELVEVGFCQDQGAGLPEAADDKGVVAGDKPRQGGGAGGGGHVEGIHIVLQHHRDAVEGTGELPGFFQPGVQPVGLLQCPGVDQDDGVDGRPLLLVGVDSGQVPLDQLAAGELPGQHGGMYLGNGCFHQLEFSHNFLLSLSVTATVKRLRQQK